MIPSKVVVKDKQAKDETHELPNSRRPRRCQSSECGSRGIDTLYANPLCQDIQRTQDPQTREPRSGREWQHAPPL